VPAPSSVRASSKACRSDVTPLSTTTTTVFCLFVSEQAARDSICSAPLWSHPRPNLFVNSSLFTERTSYPPLFSLYIRSNRIAQRSTKCYTNSKPIGPRQWSSSKHLLSSRNDSKSSDSIAGSVRNRLDEFNEHEAQDIFNVVSSKCEN
jgi:hypothetical protein